MRRVLVTGAQGLLGAAIVRELSADWDVAQASRGDLDIADHDAVSRAFGAAPPDAVINCAAYTDVDGAEGDPTGALRVNAIGVRTLADACRRAGAALIHYSTDFVFDGQAARPYAEDDAPKPRGVYASSKLIGEWFALDLPGAYVLRVESLFGPPASGRTRVGSVDTIVSRIRSGGEVPLFVDRTVSPSYTADVARATREIIVRRIPPGLYHCVNSGAATWAEVAEEAARVLGLPLHARPITLETAGLKAWRPKFCAMSNARLQAAGVPMPTWQDALRRHLGG